MGKGFQLYRLRLGRFRAHAIFHGIILINQFKSGWHTIGRDVSVQLEPLSSKHCVHTMLA